MSRSFINLRRALLGASCAIVFGVGATAAVAESKAGPATSRICPIGYYECCMSCTQHKKRCAC